MCTKSQETFTQDTHSWLIFLSIAMHHAQTQALTHAHVCTRTHSLIHVREHTHVHLCTQMGSSAFHIFPEQEVSWDVDFQYGGNRLVDQPQHRRVHRHPTSHTCAPRSSATLMRFRLWWAEWGWGWKREERGTEESNFSSGLCWGCFFGLSSLPFCPLPWPIFLYTWTSKCSLGHLSYLASVCLRRIWFLLLLGECSVDAHGYLAVWLFISQISRSFFPLNCLCTFIKISCPYMCGLFLKL
jgi:hypothetical protein